MGVSRLILDPELSHKYFDRSTLSKKFQDKSFSKSFCFHFACTALWDCRLKAMKKKELANEKKKRESKMYSREKAVENSHSR